MLVGAHCVHGLCMWLCCLFKSVFMVSRSGAHRIAITYLRGRRRGPLRTVHMLQYTCGTRRHAWGLLINPNSDNVNSTMLWAMSCVHQTYETLVHIVWPLKSEGPGSHCGAVRTVHMLHLLCDSPRNGWVIGKCRNGVPSVWKLLVVRPGNV